MAETCGTGPTRLGRTAELGHLARRRPAMCDSARRAPTAAPTGGPAPPPARREAAGPRATGTADRRPPDRRGANGSSGVQPRPVADRCPGAGRASQPYPTGTRTAATSRCGDNPPRGPQQETPAPLRRCTPPVDASQRPARRAGPRPPSLGSSDTGEARSITHARHTWTRGTTVRAHSARRWLYGLGNHANSPSSTQQPGSGPAAPTTRSPASVAARPRATNPVVRTPCPVPGPQGPQERAASYRSWPPVSCPAATSCTGPNRCRQRSPRSRPQRQPRTYHRQQGARTERTPLAFERKQP